ncbi:hypothetical protein V6N13_047340 [Hibiscus sabdariffa]|uniref:Uncharacterized protein n=1 Tax=Hibiscus sabdariffa TaxID=183260 RepID=A0ABR2F3V6_9ROSI
MPARLLEVRAGAWLGVMQVMDLAYTHLLRAWSHEISSSARGIVTLGWGSWNNPNVPTTTATTTPITSGDGGTGLNNPGPTPLFPATDESKASLDCIDTRSSVLMMLLLVLSFILHPTSSPSHRAQRPELVSRRKV